MKRIFRSLVIFVSVAVIATTLFWYTHHQKSEPQNFDAKMIQLARQLPKSGTLKIDRNGKYVYLKIDDKYVSELAPLLEPSGYITLPNSRGAHVTVFDAEELTKLPKIIPEIGETFNFDVTRMARFTKNTELIHKKFFVIRIDSKELTDLRTKYGLKTRKKGFFHITIAEQKPQNERS